MNQPLKNNLSTEQPTINSLQNNLPQQPTEPYHSTTYRTTYDQQNNLPQNQPDQQQPTEQPTTQPTEQPPPTTQQPSPA